MLDFQAQQDQARRRTGVLLAMYALGLVVVAALTAPIFVLILVAVTNSRSKSAEAVFHVLEHPVNFMATGWGQTVLTGAALFTAAVMLGASLHRLAVLRGGGGVLARELGASLATAGSEDPQERRLLNVVEEIAIAASIPTPPVYVLREESGINAFAAGYAPSDAVVVVTGGMLRRLNREQLQGVVAHEFSHILNGDMRLNIRLLALLHGIAALSLIGRVMLESGRYSRKGGGLMLPGMALLIIGAIGAGVAALIRAAISRQREYLADASAVEFTRNPAGLAGALKVVGGAGPHGRVTSARASQCNHMFFADGRASLASSLLASHPPLADRIRRLDPTWDGRWPASQVEEAPEVGRAAAPWAAAALADVRTSIPLAPAATAVPARPAAANAGSAAVAGWSAQIVLQRVQSARTRIDAIRPELLAAARDAFDAQALLLGMLLSRRPEIARAQADAIADTLGVAVQLRATALQRLLLVGEAKETRLPLVLLALGTLANLSPPQYRKLRDALDRVLAANTKMDLFKLCVQRMIAAHLDARHGGDARAVVQYYSLARLGPECSTLLSAVAAAGGKELTAEETDVLVRRSGEPLKLPGLLRGRSAAELRAVAIHDALARLGEASAPLRRRVVECCATLAGADEVLHHGESELVSAIADALRVPLM